jgi:hypothetical protein
MNGTLIHASPEATTWKAHPGISQGIQGGFLQTSSNL